MPRRSAGHVSSKIEWTHTKAKALGYTGQQHRSPCTFFLLHAVKPAAYKHISVSHRKPYYPILYKNSPLTSRGKRKIGVGNPEKSTDYAKVPRHRTNRIGETSPKILSSLTTDHSGKFRRQDMSVIVIHQTEPIAVIGRAQVIPDTVGDLVFLAEFDHVPEPIDPVG